MKILAITIAFLMAGIASGVAHGSPFITFDKPHMTRIDGMVKLQIDKHKFREKEYVFNDDQAVLERAGYLSIPQKPKGEEHYTGK